MQTYTIQNENELPALALKFLNEYSDKRIFAFYGKMGAGKTTFIKALCTALGTADTVTSPTFALVNEYQTSEFGKIFHFDFYRIEKTEEVFDMGYEEYFFSGLYCFIEWPELVESLLPEETVKISIQEQNGFRIIEHKTE
jgi:tRNA threonylcarbamoyladenosine biosynthesis protein TsaE